MLKNKAFTLSELLIALAIVGALAALSVPAIVENMNRKIMASQLKNLTLTIQNLVADLKVKNNTQTLERTDFANANMLLNSSNFAIADSCAVITNCFAPSYKSLEGNPITWTSDKTVKLKNGVTIAYRIWEQELTTAPDDPQYGLFYVDLNGVDKPNIVGRDLFAFRITKKGKIVNGEQDDTATDEQLLNYCKNATGNTGYPTACYTLIERNNWQIVY